METQFISGTSGAVAWTQIILVESCLEFTLQVRLEEKEVHVYQRQGEEDRWKLMGVEEIQEP